MSIVYDVIPNACCVILSANDVILNAVKDLPTLLIPASYYIIPNAYCVILNANDVILNAVKDLLHSGFLLVSSSSRSVSPKYSSISASVSFMAFCSISGIFFGRTRA